MTETDAHGEPRHQAGERDRISEMSDPELVAYLHRTAAEGDIAAYEAAYHEAVTVRGAAGIPKQAGRGAG